MAEPEDKDCPSGLGPGGQHDSEDEHRRNSPTNSDSDNESVKSDDSKGLGIDFKGSDTERNSPTNSDSDNESVKSDDSKGLGIDFKESDTESPDTREGSMKSDEPKAPEGPDTERRLEKKKRLELKLKDLERALKRLELKLDVKPMEELKLERLELDLERLELNMKRLDLDLKYLEFEQKRLDPPEARHTPDSMWTPPYSTLTSSYAMLTRSYSMLTSSYSMWRDESKGSDVDFKQSLLKRRLNLKRLELKVLEQRLKHLDPPKARQTTSDTTFDEELSQTFLNWRLQETKDLEMERLEHQKLKLKCQELKLLKQELEFTEFGLEQTLKRLDPPETRLTPRYSMWGFDSRQSLLKRELKEKLKQKIKVLEGKMEGLELKHPKDLKLRQKPQELEELKLKVKRFKVEDLYRLELELDQLELELELMDPPEARQTPYSMWGINPYETILERKLKEKLEPKLKVLEGKMKDLELKHPKDLNLKVKRQELEELKLKMKRFKMEDLYRLELDLNHLEMNLKLMDLPKTWLTPRYSILKTSYSKGPNVKISQQVLKSPDSSDGSMKSDKNKGSKHQGVDSEEPQKALPITESSRSKDLEK